MDLYDRATYKFEGGLGALYYTSLRTDFARVVQYEHDEYFQSKKWGGTLHCMPQALKKMRRHVPPCLNGIAAYDRILGILYSLHTTVMLLVKVFIKHHKALGNGEWQMGE